MLRTIIVLITILFLFYTGACLFLYFSQESIIFHPTKFSVDYKFNIETKYKEINLQTKDGIALNSVLFEANNPKGVVLYLHGNGDTVESTAYPASIYNNLGYDVLVPDYRGYGKSGGKIESEKQFYEDMQLFYDLAKENYGEEKVVVMGYSIGTGPAAYLASVNNPQALVLHAPYYSLASLVHSNIPFVPDFVLKYQFRTDQFIPRIIAPITIFHGTGDNTIPVESSIHLQKLLQPKDKVFFLENESHNGIMSNLQYQAEIKNVLQQKRGF